MRHLKVLLIGKGFEQARTTLSRLVERGCQYQSVSTLPEAVQLAGEERFDLVLNAIYMDAQDGSQLRDALRRARTTLLYSYEVEDGFWWILGLDRGRPCVGEAPAIPSGEFSQAIDLVLTDLAAGSAVLPGISTWFSSRKSRHAVAGEEPATQTHALHVTAP
jgi:hypothetical protein